MPLWVILVIIAVTIILGELSRPKIQDNAKAASLKDFNLPTADENRSVPVGWGTFLMDGPNVIWYGDLKTVKLTKKVRTGLFSTSRLTLGFRYSIGLQLVLCHGPVDALLEVRTGDNKVAFTGNVTHSTGDNGEDFTVDARTIYGGDSEEQLQSNGTGGVYAACTFYKGTATQLANSYMESILGVTVPAHRGVSYVVWKGPSSGNLVYNYSLENPAIAYTREPFLSGYLGTSPNIQPLSFVLKRLPNMLSGSSDTQYDINNGDANPADVIYELLTNDEWAMGLPTSFIDVDAFKAAQTTLYNEGMGFSGVWDTPKQITEVINDILSYIDGLIYVDTQTGLITLKLARKDYDEDNILVLDEDSIVEITDFSRGSWDETTNEVVVTYIDRFQKFKEKTAVAHDIANSRIQEDIISAKVSYVGISNQAIASRIASRDLRVLTLPLLKCIIKVNRKAFSVRPASVFKLNWPDYSVENVIFRAGKVRYGEIDNGQMEIEAIQDVFSLSSSIYGDGSSASWSDPVGNATTPSTFLVSECPYFYANSDAKIQVMAAQPDNSQLSYNTYTSGTVSGTYTQVDQGSSYTPTGTLDGSYSDITGDVDTVNTLVVTPTSPNNMTFLQNFSEDMVTTGQNLMLVSDGNKQEIMAFESVSYDSGTGKYTLSRIWRGLLDTVPQSWSAGARLWFFTYGDSIPVQTYTGTVYTKLESLGARDKSALSGSQAVTVQQRALKPYPPGHFRINSATSTVNISDGSNIVVTWASRNRVSQADTVYKQFAADVTAEARTEYYIKFFNATNTLLRTVGPLITQTYTYNNADQVTDNGGTEPKVVTVQLYSKRDGLFSLYSQQRTLLRPTGVAPTPPTYAPGSDTYTPPPPDDAISLNGIRICTNVPTSGQTLVYNSTNNCWEPQSLSVTLAGDVTGPSNANTVERIRNRTVSPSAPATNQFLGWNGLTSEWEPKSISSASSGSTAVTTASDVVDTHTSTNTWEDVGDMTVAYTPPEISNFYATFTCVVTGISANNEQISFRFQLDGASNSEVWTKSKTTFPTNNEAHVITVHTVFENVTANTSHLVKVQWHDSGSNLDVEIHERRLTVISCKSPFDSNFNPSVLSGLQYWFKADSLTGLVNNDPVDSMLDFSGNSRDFDANLSPDTRGLFRTSQVNGLPALEFFHDGNNATTTNTTYTGPNFLGTYTEGEVFVVLKASNDPATSSLKGSWSNFGTDSNVTHYPFTDGTVYDDFGSSVRKNTGNPATNLATWNLYNVSTKPNSWISRINGTQFFSTTTNTVAWNSLPYFGGNTVNDFDAGFEGMIAEVIFYNRVLNSSERSNVRNYISTKYSI